MRKITFLPKLCAFLVVVALNWKKKFHRVDNSAVITHLPEIKLISIRGERHSGTSWLRRIVSKNCPNLCSAVPTHGRENLEEIDSDDKYRLF